MLEKLTEKIKKKKKTAEMPQAIDSLFRILESDSALNQEGRIKSLIVWWSEWGNLVDIAYFKKERNFPFSWKEIVQLKKTAELYPEYSELLSPIVKQFQSWYVYTYRIGVR